jgi:hypothetical protein
MRERNPPRNSQPETHPNDETGTPAMLASSSDG